MSPSVKISSTLEKNSYNLYLNLTDEAVKIQVDLKAVRQKMNQLNPRNFFWQQEVTFAQKKYLYSAKQIPNEHPFIGISENNKIKKLDCRKGKNINFLP